MSAHRYCEYNCGGTDCDAPLYSPKTIVKLDEISQEAVNKMNRRKNPPIDSITSNMIILILVVCLLLIIGYVSPYYFELIKNAKQG